MASFKYPPLDAAPQSYTELTADGDKSDPIEIQDGDFDVAIWGNFIGSVSLQIKPCWRDVEADWIPVGAFTTPTLEKFPQYKGRNLVRFEAVSWSGGTAKVMIYRGEGDSRRYFVTRAPSD